MSNSGGEEVTASNHELPTVVHEDQWGIVIDHAGLDLLETRWYDTTAALTGDEFNAWLVRFTGWLEKLGRTRVLVDASAFRMNPAEVDVGFRDSEIIPRYQRAGVRRFAFQMPAGMPAIGAPPRPEGPATFPTAYFGARADALNWLTAH
jgi:hypothetical protein